MEKVTLLMPQKMATYQYSELETSLNLALFMTTSFMCQGALCLKSSFFAPETFLLQLRAAVSM